MTAAALTPTPPAQTGGDRLLAIITGLLLSGPLVAHDDADFHRAHIAWEFHSGQWVMLTDDRDRLLGWMSWYRVDEAVLALLREQDFAAVFEAAPAEQALMQGPHLYIATAAIFPEAPPDTFARLCRMAARMNLEAISVSWHHRYADGRSRFVSRTGAWSDDIIPVEEVRMSTTPEAR